MGISTTDVLLSHFLNGPHTLFYGKFYSFVSANTPRQRSAWIWEKSNAIKEKQFNCTYMTDQLTVNGPCCLSQYDKPVTIEMTMHNVLFDCDNLIKGLIDCITRAGVIEDDSQVVEIVARKRNTFHMPCVFLSVKTLREDIYQP